VKLVAAEGRWRNERDGKSMENKFKRFLSLLLSLVLVVGLLPVTGALAEESDEPVVVTTAKDLVAALMVGGEVQLGDDVVTAEIYDIVIPKDVETTLDLKGYTLSLSIHEKFLIDGDLTVLDSSEGSTGKIIAYDKLFCNNDGGTLTVKDIYITSEVPDFSGGKATSYFICEKGSETYITGGTLEKVTNGIVASGKLVIDGTKVTCEHPLTVNDGADVTVKNAELTGGSQCLNMNHGATLTIEGGNFEATDVNRRLIDTEENGTGIKLYIKGGSFVGKWFVNHTNGYEDLSITGGQFTKELLDNENNVSAGSIYDFIAEGYTIDENGCVAKIPGNDFAAFIGETKYDKLSDALKAATKGQTVKLASDVEEMWVSVYEGVTLDLNGYTLTADYVTAVGDIIDSSEGNSGLLAVAKDRIMLREDNEQLPVRDGDGYRFFEVTKVHSAAVVTDGVETYNFLPVFEPAAHALILEGSDVSGVSIGVNVSWNNASGSNVQDFVYSQTLVNKVIGGYDTVSKTYKDNYTLKLKNPQNYKDLGYTAYVSSACGVKIVSETEKSTAASGSQDVTGDENNQVSQTVTIEAAKSSATVPQGTQLEENTTKLTLTVEKVSESQSGITLAENETLTAVDVHIDGIAADNTVPMTITLSEFLDTGLNKGNLAMYHVEGENTVLMTQVDTLEEVDAHNEFYYDPATGDVTMALATFSEVTAVAEPAKWEGNYDYSWYTNAVAPVDGEAVTEYIIANADQLAAFSAIVGGMNDQAQDSFKGKTVKLASDINLGDEESENNPDIIFYPIGYYNSEGTYKRTNTAITSGFYTFEGIFDGNGHTISNFYQNTWEMKGDHNWYTPEEQYYRDGMGLFGKVYGGTVKNLTVKNFSSDGEIATTGVIAAYADFGATFENIAIFNCNPRVYNIGNGGIVGCVGWYTEGKTDKKVTFTNITVDNSNKISALWGSYDVACGGIVGQYYPTSGQSSANYPVNAGVHFENCHVSAQMDVYNDVCANYQYYAYRYTGMLIGSVRENETKNGHVYPKMDGITASGCTVHFGDWNDYYYCELVANSLASYTHDHQFSRLEEIKAINGTTITYLDGTTGTVPASGRANYVIVDYTKGHGTDNATCYHFVDGKVHNHDDYNGDGVEDYETVNGESIRVENNRHIYLEFNNLVTGYGWGVTSKGVGELTGVTILDREVGDSVEKFVKADTAKDSYSSGNTITIGELFAATEAGLAEATKILSANVMVAVSPVGEDSTAGGTYTANTTDWTQGTLTFSGTGAATITITDYYFCIPTTINVTIEGGEVFAIKLPNYKTYLYRVGNMNAVALGSLFTAAADAEVSNVAIAFEGCESAAYTENSDWTKATIKFPDYFTGVVKVTISADNAPPVSLNLEVVDAWNATTATSATANNVVLLNNVGFSQITVSGGYYLYGNGFTMTCGSDSVALDRGYAFVTMENGTLDNVQVVCPDFPYAILYEKNKTEGGKSETDANGKTRYYNIRSAVMVSGDSQILNSKISGGRVAVYVTGGDIVIDNSTIMGGAAANMQVNSTANCLTLRDVTMIQVPTLSTDKTATLMGLCVVVTADASGNVAPITLEDTLTQYAWADASDAQYVPENYRSYVNMAFQETQYIHKINGEDAINLGFICFPDEQKMPDQLVITDNRTNKEQVPYGHGDVNSAPFYSIVNTQTVDESVTTDPGQYAPDTQGEVLPTAIFDDANDATAFEKEYLAGSGTTGWKYMLTVDLDAGDYTFKFADLKVQKYGRNLSYTVKDANGDAVTASEITVEEGTKNYVLVVTDNLSCDINGNVIETANPISYEFAFDLIGSKTSIEAPQWSSDADGTALSTSMNATFEAGICVASKKGGTWHGAAPALENVYVRYYSLSEKTYKIINLADYTPSKVGKVNGTETTCTITDPEGDFTLTLTGGLVQSSKKVYAMAVVAKPTDGNNKLYFVPQNSNGLVNTGNSARTVPVTYKFVDAFGNELTGSHTWSVEEDKNSPYGYDGIVSGELGDAPSTCVTSDTLITLADGTQKRIDTLDGTEQLLVWNHSTGKLETAPIAYIVNHGEETGEQQVTHLYFSDGSNVKIIGEHVFYDADQNKYVTLDADAESFIGHTFVTSPNADGKLQTAKLVKVEKKIMESGVYEVVTYQNLTCFTDGILSASAYMDKLLNIFDVNAETLAFNAEDVQKDIETYGLYTYADFEGLISEEAFELYNAAYLKIAVGKGYITWDDVLALIDIFYNVNVQPLQ